MDSRDNAPLILTREEFRQFEKRVDDHWEAANTKFAHLEELIKQGSLHEHPHYVKWGALVTVLVSISGVAVAFLAALP